MLFDDLICSMSKPCPHSRTTLKQSSEKLITKTRKDESAKETMMISALHFKDISSEVAEIEDGGCQ
jgi:hypothetical protein